MIANGREVVEAFVAAGHVHGRHATPAELLAFAREPSKFTRGDYDPGHFTASAVIVDRERRALLLVRHPKLGAWLQPGGHFESTDRSVAGAAAREGGEETGFRLLSSRGVPMALESHRIPPWGAEPSHLHLDLRFLFEVSESDRRDPAELEARWYQLESPEAEGALGSTLGRVDEILAVHD